MALKPTIYKANLALSDFNRDHYANYTLTLAQHPSENLERMMARLMAFCLNAQDNLMFTKGLSTQDEPDIWAKTLDGQTELWIEVGEPSVDRLKKASRQAKSVKLYSFNTKSDVWWSQSTQKIAPLPVAVYQFQWPQLQALVNLVQRTMDLTVTISDNSLFVAGPGGECELTLVTLQPGSA